MLISKENSILVIIDIQESLNPVMMEPRAVIKYSNNLLKIANILDIPYIITEQVPDKLGPTIIDIKENADKNNIISKTSFSCASSESFMKKIATSGKTQVIITGIESHVCVLQTAIDLKSAGYEPFVVANAISSRKKLDYDIACNRMMKDNIIVSYEMVVFEWLRDAQNPEFKNIAKNFIDRN